MSEFLANNIGNILVSAVIIAALFFAVRSIIKNRKNNSCGCGCSECPSSSLCHNKEKK